MFINYFRHITLLLLIMRCSTPLFGEYLLYKLDENKRVSHLTKKEHSLAFEILTTYQFPMNAHFFHAVDQKNWTKDHYDLLKNESAFIQNKLNKYNIKLTFIPTTLYELLFFHLYIKDFQSNDEFNDCNAHLLARTNGNTIPKEALILIGNWFMNHYENETIDTLHIKASNKIKQLVSKLDEARMDKKRVLLKELGKILVKENTSFFSSFENIQKIYSYLYREYDLTFGNVHLLHAYKHHIKRNELDKKWNEKTYLQAATSINKASKALHHAVNNNIISFIKDKDPKLLTHGTSKCYENLAHTVLQKLKTQLQEIREDEELEERCTAQDGIKPIYEFIKNDYFKSKHRYIITQCIKTEIDNHKKNNWILYRGTDGNEFKKEWICHRSRSFGNSLFAGLIRECNKSKGAMVYIYYLTESVRSMVTINKKDYLKKKDSYKLFFVQPLNTLTGLSLHGETFHPRSKVIPNNLDGVTGLQGKSELDLHYLHSPVVNQNDNANTLKKLFKDYFKQNLFTLENR